MATPTRRLAALLAGITDNDQATKVTTAGIDDDAVNAAKIAANAVGTSEVADNVLTATDLAANSVGESELSVDYTAQSVPHIVPGVLYPAVDGKGIDGTTTITSFGTDVAISGFPTLKYYYTNIKGSKPIKDPRIGAHFGSQRHKFKSLQLLEQETATEGKEVKCADGREWVRFVDGNWSWHIDNDANGSAYIAAYSNCTDNFFEVTGYFNDINFILQTGTARANEVDITVNGTLSVDGSTTLGGVTSVGTPLGSRYVDAGSVINGGSTLSTSLGTTPKINTVKFEIKSGSSKTFYIHGIELIAQDTTSTANRSKIQIPSQNVVSYGKKFPISATADHYDPFSAKTDGSAWTSPTSGTNNANSAASWPTNIDTAHSLGLDKWVDGSSYYRPYNGGRVVKYVDSTGTIKTAVTVMPPNAKSIKSDDINKKAKDAGNTTYLPTFENETTDVNEDLLHEVAKTFHVKEFGNGAANGGTGASWADTTMLTGSADNIAYVMDDGLTNLSGTNAGTSHNSTFEMNGIVHYDSDYSSFSFIGTGVSLKGANWSGGAIYNLSIAQNLSYGTHLYKMDRNTASTTKHFVDGVELKSTSLGDGHMISEITFYQPKKPPIPEDACVIADYMLMADFLPVGAEGLTVSKGVRRVSASRDLLYNCDQAINLNMEISGIAGFQVEATSGSGLAAGDFKGKLPAFGTQFVARGYGANRRDIFVNDSDVAQTDSSSNSAHNTYNYPAAVALGVNTFESRSTGTATGNIEAFEIATPIHTSSHYQSFETPFLHELVGGDRNMEQTNLIVSPDGKTWDQITRDTSYIGSLRVRTTNNNHYESHTSIHVNDEWRGNTSTNYPTMNKDFAIAYDRVICLVAGEYQIFSLNIANNQDQEMSAIYINGVGPIITGYIYHNTGNNESSSRATLSLKRGDYIQIKGANDTSVSRTTLEITRM